MQVRKLKIGLYIEARCNDLVPEGYGISHIDTDQFKPITGFVLGVLPGEEFVARVTRVKSNHFHAVLATKEELTEYFAETDEDQQWIGKKHSLDQVVDQKYLLFSTSKERVPAPCPIFLKCGGCKLLHLSYEHSLDYKKKWHRTHLERNKVTATDDEPEIIDSPARFGYRNHVQIHINKFKERGFYAPFSYRTTPFPEKGCLLFAQKESDNNFPQELELERCVRFRYDHISKNSGHWSLYSNEDKTARFSYTIAYPEGSETRVEFPNTAFFQTNTQILPLWLGTIRNFIKQSSRKEEKPVKVLELFSGFGFISRMISMELNLEPLGIDILKPSEIDQTKISNNRFTPYSGAEYRKNYLQHDLTRLDVIKDEARNVIAGFNPDVVLMNPPRSGFQPDQIRYLFGEILENKYQGEIIYSSCNSATLARDLATFQELSYIIDESRLFDFFPWTSHFEVVARLRRK